MSLLNGRHERGDFMIDGAVNQTLSAGNASYAVIVPIIGYKGLSIVESFNADAVHTLVATLQAEISNDYEWANPLKVATWDPITDPSIVAWLTTDVSATPPGGKPNAIVGTGSIMFTDLDFAAFRFTVTRTAGTGLYVANFKLSGQGRR